MVKKQEFAKIKKIICRIIVKRIKGKDNGTKEIKNESGAMVRNKNKVRECLKE